MVVSPLSVVQVVLMLLFFSVLLGLYVAPLYITSPCIMDPESLGPRPDVIGQRGAPMVSRPRCCQLDINRTSWAQSSELPAALKGTSGAPLFCSSWSTFQRNLAGFVGSAGVSGPRGHLIHALFSFRQYVM